ncbi:MAG: arsenate reductase ArsC [Bacteroidota bacterium]|nr:arsenate reductase ArsC [Bacteroidota bacterium]
MYKILFVCIHNSARSQMAEAFLNQLGNGKFKAESAGIEKGKLNPYVIRAMQEVGIDISNNETKEVFHLFRQGKLYQAVITVCEKEAAERCPVFPGILKRIAWSFPDPSKFTGTDEEILAKVRVVRDEIKEKVIQFIEEVNRPGFWMQDSIYTASEE